MVVYKIRWLICIVMLYLIFLERLQKDDWSEKVKELTQENNTLL